MIIFTNQRTNGTSNGDCPRTRVAGVVAHHNLIEMHAQTGSEKRRGASSKWMLDDRAVLGGMFMSFPFLEHILDFISISSKQRIASLQQIITKYPQFGQSFPMLSGFASEITSRQS